MARKIENKGTEIKRTETVQYTPHDGDDYDELLKQAGILIEGMYSGDEDSFRKVKALRKGFALRRDIYLDAERQLHLRMLRIGN